MKILVVSEPGLNGVFRYVESLCYSSLQRGIEVHLAYSDVRGSDSLLTLIQLIESKGGETFNLKVGNAPSFKDVRAFLGLWAMARRIRPDIIHSHSSKAGALARGLALAGHPAVYFYHPHAYRGMRPDRSGSDIIYDTVESILGRIGHTINVSAGEHAHAKTRLSLSPKKLHLIANGVATKRFVPAEANERAQLRTTFGLPPDAQVLGTLGRYCLQKDPLTLYRAFALSAAENPRLYLFHVGTGELEAEVTRLVNNEKIGSRVIRVPYLANTTQFYKVVDGFMLTSVYEGFSLAILEALSANLPLILSRAPGNSDFSAHDLSHLWYAECGDDNGFSQAIRAWTGALADNRTCNHRTLAVSRFENDTQFDTIADLYHQFIPPHKGLYRSSRPATAANRD